MSELLHNWAGNIAFGTARLHHPETVAQVQEIVRRGTSVRVLGSGHSFSPVADTTGDLLSLARLDPDPVFDRARQTVTVGAGVTYRELCPLLHREGYALHNTASLPHITIAGACATATHGSGDGNGNLATAVVGLEIVTGGGEVVTLSREGDADIFPGAVVALGALGVVTKLTLALEPAFAVRQDVYENLPLAALADHFDAITSTGYSVSMFTNWQREQMDQVWVKRRAVDGDTDGEGVGTASTLSDLFGAMPAPAPRHPLAGHSAEACTPQMGAVGPWYDRLPHFRADALPSSGAELQSEYFIPRSHAVTAFGALYDLRQHLAPLLMVSEVRTVAADDLWLSPCDGRDCVALHFTWQHDWEGVRAVLPLIEERITPLDAAPHWGKVFTMPPAQVQSRYPKLAAFRELAHRHDPAGIFRNAFLDTYLFGAA